MTRAETIEEAVRRAQKDARKNGLKVGQAVAHPGDPLTYELLEIRGDEAIVGLSSRKSPSGREIRKVFPVAELFSPDTVLSIAWGIERDDLLRICPGMLVVEP